MNLVVDVAGPTVTWTAWNLLVAVAVPRLPADWLGRHDRPCRTRRRNPLAVRRWKHVLPDAGRLLPGGTAKRHLPGRDRPSLIRYGEQLHRGELTHWLSMLAAPLLGCWWPAVVVVPMLLVAVVLNAPCIVVLRFNRDRVRRSLARPSRWTASPGRAADRGGCRTVAPGRQRRGVVR